MKQISLIAILVIAVIISSCGKKEEKKEALSDNNNEIVDESKPDTSANYTSYEEFVSDGSDNAIAAIDTAKKSDMVFIEPTNEIQIDPPVDTKKEPVKEIKKEVKKETKKEVKKEVVKEDQKSHELRYYIVVGSFKQYSNAQNLNSYFKTKGYTPMILPKANGYNRVAISSFPKETEARNSIQKLRTQHNDLTFWLYKW